MSRGMIHHIEIYVDDLEKSRQFWGWLLKELGYMPFQNWDKGFSFKLKDSYLTFVQTDEKYKDIPYHRCRTGLNHLAFHAGSRQDVDEITQKLRAGKGKVLYEDKHPFAGGPDYYAVFFEDPNRIKVEIVAPENVNPLI